MAETFGEAIIRVKEEDLKVFSSLKPEDCLLVSDVTCSPHYTLICSLPDELTKRIEPFYNEIRGIEGSMIFNLIQKLHLTIFHCDLTVEIKRLEHIILSQFWSLTFNLDSLFATTLGVGVAAYPTDESLWNLRSEFLKLTGKELDKSYRGLISWVTLARYTQPPSQDLLDFLRNHKNDDFGVFTPEKMELYKSFDKNLINCEKIAEYKLEV